MAPGGATRWFMRVTWLGIVANLGLALPTLFAPLRMVALTGLPTPDPLLWLRFSALLLVLLSAFYVPAALDPRRYRLVAWLAVLARLAGDKAIAPRIQRRRHVERAQEYEQQSREIGRASCRERV